LASLAISISISLALSWSPEYCAANGSSDPSSAASVENWVCPDGLWPEFEVGYPSDCSTQRLPADLKTKYAGLYPSPSLFDHEWEKHGHVLRLAPEEYLVLSSDSRNPSNPNTICCAEQPVRVSSARLKKDFATANSGMRESSLATYCTGSGRYFQELRVCLALDGKPIACQR